MSYSNIIWKYWEGEKPDYIKKLDEQQREFFSGEIITLDHRSVFKYIPELPERVWCLNQIAQRADVIRSFLLKKYGGAWIDSDIIFVKKVDFYFDYLREYSLVSFNEDAAPSDKWRLRVGVLFSRKNDPIITRWSEKQIELLNKPQMYKWTSFGADSLHQAAKELNFQNLKIDNIQDIEPIHWKQSKFFHSETLSIDTIINDNTSMLSIHNSQLYKKVFSDNSFFSRLLKRYAKATPDNRVS